MSRFVAAAAVIVASALAVVDGWPEWGVAQESETVALKMGGDDGGVIALKMGGDDGVIALKMGGDDDSVA